MGQTVTTMPYPTEVKYVCPCGPAPIGSERPGYTILPDERLVCVPYAAQWEVESGTLAGYTSGERTSGYVMGDPTRTDQYKATRVTTRLGNELMRITEAHYGARRYSGHPDAYFYSGSSYAPLYLRAVDSDGNEWRGWGSSERDLVTLRRIKSKHKAA